MTQSGIEFNLVHVGGNDDTIDGLLAEFRGYSAGMPPSYHVTMSWADFRKMLDRFDAAHRREMEAVGDAKKLGAALLEIRDAMRVYMSVGGISARRTIEMAFEIARDALAAPPRNCDVYDNESCRMAYHLHGDGLMTMQAFADWLFAPATEQEGGAK